ncbi:MAG: hypothetical protein F4Y02_17645 [Chloroflexi bacterium]|nr:hypothetical protein [Chloroflexota bacterium]
MIPDPLVFTPEILDGVLAAWGVPLAWHRHDVAVWSRLYRLDPATGAALTRGDSPKPVPVPPPGYHPEVVTAAFWKRLQWGVIRIADPEIVRMPGKPDMHRIVINETPWDTGGRAKPTWAELQKLVLAWWLDGATAELLGDEAEGWTVDRCVKQARDAAGAAVKLPYGVCAQPRALTHMASVRAADGTFPVVTCRNAAGDRVEITTAGQAEKLAKAAIAESNRLESARNRLVAEALPHVRLAADLTGGLEAAATEVARLNARARALNKAHQLLGPDTIDAEYRRHLKAI